MAAERRAAVIKGAQIPLPVPAGYVDIAAQQRGVPVYEYTPMQVKQSVVGYGKAEKKQVMEMTRILLRLPSVPKPDDTADALALAICHAHCAGSGLDYQTRYQQQLRRTIHDLQP